MSANKLLRDAYQRNGDRPVAFIDESLRGPHEPGFPYYILTAVVVPATDMEALREGLEDLVGGTYWHTSEEMLKSGGYEKTKELLTYLSQGKETSVVSVNLDIKQGDDDLEGARRHCMRLLLTALQQETELRDPSRLAVMEQRRGRTLQNRDARTYTELVNQKVVSQHFRVLQVSPRDEHLLWLPDLVSRAVRRQVAFKDNQLIDILSGRLERL
jgi:hypothetical protein